jgi:trimeric autotransporter adhesin
MPIKLSLAGALSMNRVRNFFFIIALVLVGVGSAPREASAQSDILLQLRSGSPAGDRVRVDSAGGFVALGQIGVGIIPASGAGWRMMWHPFKVAFRAGYADAGGQFDDAKIGFYSWAGGALSAAPGNYAFAMGNQNLAEAQCAVALGSGNNVFGNATDGFATCGLALGLNNDVHDQAGISLGQNNNSDGDAAVAIGYTSTADADYSMAFGYRASTNGHTGAKVFGDASTTDSIEAVANNEFAVRAAGGFRFRSNATLTNGCNIAAGGASITCSSDRNLKEGFRRLNGEDVLKKLRRIPVTEWNFKDETTKARHIGPMAQDFYREFKLGTSDKEIAIQDAAAVGIVASKALDERTRAMQAELKSKDAKIANLGARLVRLEKLITEKK